MTKTEALRRFRLDHYLIACLGFTADEVVSLRRISSTLQRWHELECGTDHGALERDDATGKPFWVSHSLTHSRRSPVADREAGALRRLTRIISARNERTSAPVETYIQTDPRGAALYILRPGDVPEGLKPEACYTRGVCVF